MLKLNQCDNKFKLNLLFDFSKFGTLYNKLCWRVYNIDNLMLGTLVMVKCKNGWEYSARLVDYLGSHECV